MMTGLETTLLILLICILIAFFAFAYFLWKPFYYKMKYGIRNEVLTKNKAQKRIVKQFEREYNRLIQLNAEPFIVDNFPKTLDLIEEYGQENFGKSLFLTQLLKPVIEVIARLNPTNPTEQKIVSAAQTVQQFDPLTSIAMNFIQNILSKPKQPLPGKPGERAEKSGKNYKPKVTQL